MKLKYYLRGLGIGIVVTAVIMQVAQGHRKETLSDREIKERAAALGMVEQSSLLADLETTPEALQATEEPLPEETVQALPEETPESTPAGMPEETAGPTETPEEEAPQIPTTAPKETPGKDAGQPEDASPTDSETVPAASSGEEVTIEILSGEGSYTICQKLEKAGLIASASDFDVYLYTNGYDRKLRIGSYQVPVGAEPETIAAILTRMQ